MKIKNIHSSLIVFFILIIASFAFFAIAQEQNETAHNIFLDSDQDGLSDEEEKSQGTDPRNADSDGDSYSDGAEVRSGYNPLIASPGDKLIPDTVSAETTNPENSNMTKEMSQKISTLISTADSENPEITIDQIKQVVEESIQPSFEVNTDDFPEITKDDVKIKKTSFKGLSASQIAEKKKNNFADYLAGVAYVISSNSPTPITSTSDVSSLYSSMNSDIISAITSRNPESLEKLEESTEKIMAQLKDIEVPEDLVETHIQTLRAVRYSQELKKGLAPNTTDPVADIANLAKIQGFSSYLISFSEDMAKKFDSYGLTYDDSVKEKFNSYGIALPSEDIMKLLSQ